MLGLRRCRRQQRAVQAPGARESEHFGGNSCERADRDAPRHVCLRRGNRPKPLAGVEPCHNEPELNRKDDDVGEREPHADIDRIGQRDLHALSSAERERAPLVVALGDCIHLELSLQLHDCVGHSLADSQP